MFPCSSFCCRESCWMVHSPQSCFPGKMYQLLSFSHPYTPTAHSLPPMRSVKSRESVTWTTFVSVCVSSGASRVHSSDFQPIILVVQVEPEVPGCLECLVVSRGSRATLKDAWGTVCQELCQPYMVCTLTPAYLSSHKGFFFCLFLDHSQS